jgi:mRNA interferase MazF
MSFIKNFIDWFRVKPKLDQLNHKPPFVEEGNIWWCYIGENIGTEISGKGDKFSRPVLILRKLSKFTFLTAPLSTKIKQGSWYVKFFQNDKEVVACLNQIKIIDYRRLDDRIGKIDNSDFEKVKKCFNDLYKL